MPRIFLIQHDPDFASVLKRIFEAEGFDVGHSVSVNDAIDQIESFSPNLTLVDLNDGFSIGPDDITRLASLENGQPILVTADYNSPDIACRAIGAGASDYILKPFGTREIIDMVHTVAGTRNVNGSPSDIDRIADTIGVLSSVEDIAVFTIDQLSRSLSLSDCLMALDTGKSFTVVASKGYSPDPTGRTVMISDESLSILGGGLDDNIETATSALLEVCGRLGIKGHRPFPTLMPLSQTDDVNRPLPGFVLGHGALVHEENDIRKMENFLHRITGEIDHLINCGLEIIPETRYEHAGEIKIPETDRNTAIEKIIGIVAKYLPAESDQIYIRLVLDEAVNNGIIHGHLEPLGSPTKNLKVTYHIGPERIVLTIEDQGEGFDHDNLPDPTAEENLLNINGRGIFIMKKIMDEVIFNRAGNRISLVKTLDGKSLAPKE